MIQPLAFTSRMSVNSRLNVTSPESFALLSSASFKLTAGEEKFAVTLIGICTTISY